MFPSIFLENIVFDQFYLKIFFAQAEIKITNPNRKHEFILRPGRQFIIRRVNLIRSLERRGYDGLLKSIDSQIGKYSTE